MKKFNSIILFALFIMLFYSCSLTDKNIVSPNGKIRVNVQVEKQSSAEYGNAYFSIEQIEGNNKKVIFDKVKLGLETDMQRLTDNLMLVSISDDVMINDDYTMITGKRSHCINQAIEKTYTFENPKGQKLDVVIRAYNNGVVFRYEFSAIEAGENIIAEHTTYPIAEGTKRWMQPYDPGYEDFYPMATDGAYEFEPKWNRIPNMWGYPALIESQESVFTLITEANILRGHCASRLNNAHNPNEYRINLADEKIPVSGSRVSPWRVLIIGSLADVVESTLVTDVSEPSKVTDTDWIVPGSSAWIYWAYNYGSNDFRKVKEYIDLAAEMGWPYNLIDWKWDEMGNGGNIEDAVKYSIEKGVKPMVWYNSSTAWIGPGAPEPLYRLNEKKNRLKEYAWLKDLGIVGIKVDFFNGDDSATMNYYIDMLEDAAKYKLLMNFHGATIPRGWQRTYPHMMTVEGVYGAEWYNNLPVLTEKAASHNTTLPFTRNVIGPMDYTPGTFSDSQHPHITTHGHELALHVIFESALQHMPDRPSSYLSQPEPVKEFLSKLPTAWDDTKLLSGYPGEFIVLARCKGDVWYIGGLNGTDEPRILSFKKDFLPDTAKTLTLFKDGSVQKSFTIEENLPITNMKNTLEVECLPRGGFVAVIK